jgi:hypothetical protein
MLRLGQLDTTSVVQIWLRDEIFNLLGRLCNPEADRSDHLYGIRLSRGCYVYMFYLDAHTVRFQLYRFTAEDGVEYP